MVASDYTVSAGGPATNAAVTFSHLGDRATVLSAVGCHPITHLIRADLEQRRVAIADLTPSAAAAPPISSIIVSEATGDRAVIAINAVKRQIGADILPATILDDVKIVLIDGHQMPIGRAIAQMAQAKSIPIVIDGGSWKPGFETVLSLASHAICSANFQPPGCSGESEVLDYLIRLGIPQIAITHGDRPIRYWHQGQSGWLKVPRIQPVDTLGAGDIFHGAFCHAILRQDFVAALAIAARTAAHSCQSFGTRRWMESPQKTDQRY